jgi:hypothetical protein
MTHGGGGSAAVEPYSCDRQRGNTKESYLGIGTAVARANQRSCLEHPSGTGEV